MTSDDGTVLVFFGICTGKYKDGLVDGKKTCVSIYREEENNSAERRGGGKKVEEIKR